MSTPQFHTDSLSSTPKTPQFNTPQFNTPLSPSWGVELSGVWNWGRVDLGVFGVELTDFGRSPFLPQKSPSSTPKTPHFNTSPSVPHKKPLSSTHPLRSTPKTPSVPHKNALYKRALQFFRSDRECCIFCPEVRLYEMAECLINSIVGDPDYEHVDLFFRCGTEGFLCWTEEFLVLNWGILGLKRCGPCVELMC